MNQPHNPHGNQNPQQGYPPQQPQQWGQPQQPQQQQQQPQWGQPQQPQQQQGYPQQQQQGYPPQQQQQQQQWDQQQQPEHGGGQSYGDDDDVVAAEASPQARAKFIERTYMHLALAIAAFVVLETIVQMLPITETITAKMLGGAGYASWGIVLLAFMAVSWIADRWASNSASLGMQYAGLALYTIAEVVIFIPMIFIAKQFIGVEAIMMAGGATLAIFSGLTAYVFISKKDFSFLGGILPIIGMGVVALIFGGIFFGFNLGVGFSVGMIVFAGGYILYYTSNVLKHYRTTQHVAAALALFSAVALLFWYVLRLAMQLARD